MFLTTNPRGVIYTLKSPDSVIDLLCPKRLIFWKYDIFNISVLELEIFSGMPQVGSHICGIRYRKYLPGENKRNFVNQQYTWSFSKRSFSEGRLLGKMIMEGLHIHSSYLYFHQTAVIPFPPRKLSCLWHHLHCKGGKLQRHLFLLSILFHNVNKQYLQGKLFVAINSHM